MKTRNRNKKETDRMTDEQTDRQTDKFHVCLVDYLKVIAK